MLSKLSATVAADEMALTKVPRSACDATSASTPSACRTHSPTSSMYEVAREADVGCEV